MKKNKSRLDEIAEESKDVSTSSETVCWRSHYEQVFERWLKSDVELIQVTAHFRLKRIDEAAQLAVDYFTRQREQGRPLVISGLALALRMTSSQALDNYKTYHPDYAEFIDTAKQMCENYAEEMLFSKVNSGAKFVLMNRNKWSNVEKQEVTTHNIDVKI